MLEQLLWITLGGISTGLFYSIFHDLLLVKGQHKYNKNCLTEPFTYKTFINKGSWFGGIIGGFRGYVGCPLLDYIKNNTC